MNHLYFTVGISGCGKNYWCDQHAGKNDIILDSDMIRAELWNDASDQQQPDKVFNLMFKRACEGLRANHNVYYSQTGLSFKHRISFIKNIRAKFSSEDVALHCVILIAPIEVCKKRNAMRARHVPDEVIDRQVRQFQIPVEAEGWDSIEVIPTYSFNQQQYAAKLLNELYNFGSQENKHHALDLYWHSYNCRTNITCDKNIDVRNAAFLHDIGKIYTKTYWPQKDNDAHYPNHAEVGSYHVLLGGYSLLTAQIINYHMLPYADMRAQQTWKKRLGEPLWNMILALHWADEVSH